MRAQARSFRSVVAPFLVGCVALGVARAGADPQGRSAPLSPVTPDMMAVQDLLGRATEDVAQGNGSDLLMRLSRADRGRINAPGDWPDVAKAAGDFRAAWQARFGTSFKLSDKIPVVMSEPSVHVIGLEPTAGGPSTQPTADRESTASVLLKSPGRRSATKIKLVNEGTDKPDWHLDLPQSVTAGTLHDSLLQHLNAVTANQARWPTDVDQAYVYVTEHLLGAVGDADPVK